MGVDAVILSKGTWNDEVTAGNLQAYLPEGSRLYVDSELFWDDYEPDAYRVTTTDYENGVIELDCGLRYFDDAYSKGHWPTIANAIEAMRSVFGNVYYSGDYFTDNARLIEEVGEWTQEQTAELWRVWNKQQEYEQADQQAEREESVLTRLEAWLEAEYVCALGRTNPYPVTPHEWGKFEAFGLSLGKLRELRDKP